MSLTPYRRVLALPGVTSLTIFGVLARVPLTASAVVLTLHVVGALGRGYAAAGLVATAATAGAAIGAPWRGRAVDRFGLRWALVPSIVGEAVVWGSAPWLPYPALLVAAVVGGLLGLPVFTVVRQSLSVLVPAEQRRTAYAMDSIGVELSFMIGPAVGVLLATQASTKVALLAVGVAMVVSGIALVAFNPPTSTRTASRQAGSAHSAVRGRPTVRSRRRDWMSPALLGVLAASAGATLVLSGTDVSVVAVLRHVGAVGLTGLVFFFWGLGSMIGGLVYGAVHRTAPPLLLLLGLALLTVPVGLASTPVALCLAIVPAGLLCAPTVSSTAEVVARLVPEHSRGEAMGWHASALTVGGAVGAPVAGALIDRWGAWAGFVSTGAAGAVLAVVALALQAGRRGRRLPDVMDEGKVALDDGVLGPQPAASAGIGAA